MWSRCMRHARGNDLMVSVGWRWIEDRMWLVEACLGTFNGAYNSPYLKFWSLTHDVFNFLRCQILNTMSFFFLLQS